MGGTADILQQFAPRGTARKRHTPFISMRAKLCLLIVLFAAGCSTTSPKVAPYSPPADNASPAEWDAYAAGKREGSDPTAYPAWTGPASVLARVASVFSGMLH